MCCDGLSSHLAALSFCCFAADGGFLHILASICSEQSLWSSVTDASWSPSADTYCITDFICVFSSLSNQQIFSNEQQQSDSRSQNGRLRSLCCRVFSRKEANKRKYVCVALDIKTGAFPVASFSPPRSSPHHRCFAYFSARP